MDRLTEADLLFVEGAPSEANYHFKHALIQDAAYDSLLCSRAAAERCIAAPPNSFVAIQSGRGGWRGFRGRFAALGSLELNNR